MCADGSAFHFYLREASPTKVLFYLEGGGAPSALTSLFGTFIPAYLFAIAQTKVSSSICSILNSLTPLNTLIIGAIVFGLNFRRNQIFGIIIGLIGTVVLIFNGRAQGVSEDNSYFVFVLIATVCYATNVNLIKNEMVSEHSTKNEDTFIIVKDPKRVSQGKIKMVFSNNPISLKSWTITNQSKQKTKVLLRNLDEKVKIPI